MAEALEVGAAYLNLLPSARDLQKKTSEAVKKVNAPDILAQIDLDISKLDKQASAARAKLEQLRATRADPQIDLDIAAFRAKIAQAEQKLSELRGKEASAKVTADITSLEAQIGRANSSIQRLESKRGGPKITADIAAAEANVSTIDRKISALQAKRATVQVNASGAAATSAQLDAVQSKANRLNGSRASVNIAAAGGAQASGMLGLIVAGLAAVAAAAPAAVAALGAVAGTASALGQAGGAAAAGFSGIGDAIKAVEADEKSAATSSAGAAKSRSNSASQIASAQSSLQQAVVQADRAAITGGQQVAQARTNAARTQIQGADSVADASRAVARAQQQADRTSITSGQQVAAARRAVSDAIVSANERTQAAERAVGRAQESARWAQESLTRARRDAAEANDDLQLSLSGVAISEKRATLQLRKALAARAGGGDVDPEMFKSEELDLDVAEAAQNLAEVRERFGDLRAEQARFAAGGIDGSDQVIAAQRAVRDANLGVEDSVRSLTQTQRDGSRSVQDAVLAQSQAQQQAAWAQQDAAAGVADAQLASGRAARDAAWANQDAAQQTAQASQQAAWAQQDAAKGVADAQRGLQDALAATAEEAGGAGAAGKKSAWELAQLTPAGRSFVAFWLNEWKPAMQGVSDAVAGEMLPRVERSMRQLLGLQPELKAGLSGTGAVLGDLAVKGSDLATSPAFRASFVQIMDSNNRSLTSWGNAAISGADSARILTVAGLPLSERLARMAEGASQSAESFLLQKESTGELAAAMQFGADKAGQLWRVVVDLAEAAYKVGVAIAPVGEAVLGLVSGVAQAVGEFASANQGLTQFIVTAGLAVAGTNALAKGIVAVQASAAIARGGLKTLWTVVSTGLNPAALAGTSALSGFQSRMQQAAPVVGTFTQGLTRSETAGKAADKATRGFGSAVRYGAASLPILGVAIAGIVAAGDAMNTSFDEGVEKVRQGGVAQAEFRAELAKNDADMVGSQDKLYNWLRVNVAGIQTTKDFDAELAKQRTTWSNLQNAQFDATQAQGNYEQKVREFGPASAEATAALADLNAKTRGVEIAQIAVREKTDLATAAMLWQRDQILAALDADLRLRMSKQQLAKDQQAVADAIKNSGPASQEANDAQLQLEQTQLRTAEAAKSSAGGQRAYVDSIRDMIATSPTLTPTLQGLIGSLDASGLAAIGAKVHIDEAGRAVVSLPGGKTMVLDANTAPALQGMAGVTYQLGLVPPGKTITVNALTEPEKQKLIDLGFTVNTLPNGNVQVTANDAQARGTLQAFQAFAAWQVANPQLAADPAKAYGAMQGFLRDAGAQTGVPMLDTDPARADATVRGKLDEFNRWNATPAMHIDTKPAQQEAQGFWDWLGGASGFDWTQRLLGRGGGGPVPPGRRDGGPVGYAGGGRITHRQVFTGMDAGGRVRGPGGPTADRVPLMGSAGEYMVRARAVNAVGVPFLDAVNGMRDGGYIGRYAAGGKVKPQPGQPAATGALAEAAPVAVPTGDPAAAASAGSATTMLAGAMGAATGAAGALAPQLAAVTAQQRTMVASGVTPLATAMLGQLVPAVAAGNAQIGVAAPFAHQMLQNAQVQTQLSTGATAANAAMNNAGIAATTTGMSVQAQAQHAGLRAGQVATQLTTGQTAAVTAAQNAGMVATTTGMSLANQAQHMGLRLGQQATQASTTQTAAVTYAKNTEMAVTTGVMSQVNQGHLGALRGAQGVTTQSTVGFADAWRDQMGRTQPDSGRPVKWIIDFPINSLVGAWNALDAQFALGKHVEPPRANFAGGGPVFDRSAYYRSGGKVSGGQRGRDSVPAMLMPGEVVWSKPAVDNAGGPASVQAMHLSARAGQIKPYAAANNIPIKAKDLGPLGMFADGGPVQFFDQGGLVAFGRRLQGMGYQVAEHPAFGGVGDHGPRSLHYSGNAIDVNKGAGTSPQEQAALSQVVPLARGYGLRTIFMVEGHYNHAHFDTGQGGDMRGGGGGGFFDVGPIVDGAFKKAYDQIGDIPKFFGPSDQVARGAGVAKASADAVKGKATEKLTEMFAVASGGPGAEQWRGVALEALRRTGQPLSLVDRVLQQIQIESSGNPRAINNWDINARRGTPSKGLIQTIDPTFQRWRDRSLANDPYDPLANIVAGIRYAVATYGGIQNIWPKKMGYDNGGLLPPGQTMVENRTGFPERVLNNVETRSYDTLTRLVGRDGSSLDLGAFEPRGETHNHFMENTTIRETVDVDQAMQRAEFLAGTASL